MGLMAEYQWSVLHGGRETCIDSSQGGADIVWRGLVVDAKLASVSSPVAAT